MESSALKEIRKPNIESIKSFARMVVATITVWTKVRKRPSRAGPDRIVQALLVAARSNSKRRDGP